MIVIHREETLTFKKEKKLSTIEVTTFKNLALVHGRSNGKYSFRTCIGEVQD